MKATESSPSDFPRLIPSLPFLIYLHRTHKLMQRHANTHTSSPKVIHITAKLLITRYFTGVPPDHQMLLPRWDLWPYLVARSNCTNQDPILAQKAGRQIWIRRMANLMRIGLEIKNDDCSRIRCGLGQSGVDDGAGQENGRSWRGET